MTGQPTEGTPWGQWKPQACWLLLLTVKEKAPPVFGGRGRACPTLQKCSERHPVRPPAHPSWEYPLCLDPVTSNKSRQARWLRRTDMYSLTVLEARSPQLKWRQGRAPSDPWRQGCPSLLPGSGSWSAVLAPLCLPGHRALSSCVSVTLFFIEGHQSRWIKSTLLQDNLIFANDNCNEIYFQIS